MSVRLSISRSESQEVPERTHHFGFDGCYVWVQQSGPGRHDAPKTGPIVFVHGRFGSSPIWTPIARRLGADRLCATFDLPGFGRSVVASGRWFTFSQHVALLSRILDQLVDTNGDPATNGAVLVGHDVGGALIQAVSVLRPEKVAALVLVNSACASEELPRTAARSVRKAFREAGGRISPLDEAGARSVREDWGSWFGPARVNGPLKALHETWPGEQQRRVWREGISSLRQPVLLVWGALNSFHPVGMAFRLMRMIDRSYYTEIDSSSLWPSLEAPGLLSSRLREFLFRIGSGAELTARRSL